MADLKPPFPSSPIRIRHRSVLRTSIPNTAAAQNQIGSLSKTQSVPRSISSEFLELTKMVNKDDNEKPNSSNFVLPEKSKSISKPSPLFERGRFYDEYSARRNERLKRKKMSEEKGEENKTICDLSFVSEPVKKRNVKKFDDFKISEVKESVNPIPRYSLRSRSKENKMPPLPPSSIRKPAASRARKS